MILTTTDFSGQFSAPPTPEVAEKFLPKETESFSDGLFYIIKSAVLQLNPAVAQAAGICLSLIAVILLVAVLENYSGASKQVVQIVSVVTVATILIRPSNALVTMGIETVQELSEYGKLLLPVMTGALAAQGGTTTSTALYVGTAFFNALLTRILSHLFVPVIYIYTALCVANHAIGDKILEDLKKFAKWLMTWGLKMILYVFTGYIGITGVVSGTADAAAVKAAKLAISGAVPVVGSIISDASETILVGAGIMKSATGITGLLTVLAIWIGPFLKIAVQYLFLKLTVGICSVFGGNREVNFIRDFSGIMGYLLAMTGTMCLMLLISTVCFMKGVS